MSAFAKTIGSEERAVNDADAFGSSEDIAERAS